MDFYWCLLICGNAIHFSNSPRHFFVDFLLLSLYQCVDSYSRKRTAYISFTSIFWKIKSLLTKTECRQMHFWNQQSGTFVSSKDTKKEFHVAEDWSDLKFPNSQFWVRWLHSFICLVQYYNMCPISLSLINSSKDKVKISYKENWPHYKQ